MPYKNSNIGIQPVPQWPLKRTFKSLHWLWRETNSIKHMLQSLHLVHKSLMYEVNVITCTLRIYKYRDAQFGQQNQRFVSILRIKHTVFLLYYITKTTVFGQLRWSVVCRGWQNTDGENNSIQPVAFLGYQYDLLKSICSTNQDTSCLVQEALRTKSPVFVCLNFPPAYEYRKFIENRI
jgi:hypothetical protein